MGNLTDFLTSNYLKATDLEPGVLIEAKIVSVRPVDFEDGTTKPVIYTDYQGKGVVLNQARLKAVISAYGPNPDNLIGKGIIIRQGMTMYAGEKVACVEIEPVVADRIGAEKRATIGLVSGGSTDKGAWKGPKRAWGDPPERDLDDPGPGPIDDDIPF